MKDLTEASIISVKEYNVKRICVHSSKFAFSVSRYDIKKEEESLMAGCIAAGLKFSDTPKIGKIVVKKRKVDGFGVCSITGFYNPLSEKITGLGDVFSSVQAVKSLF
jgi:ADP-dependent phosphofructokinase/glucokinase